MRRILIMALVSYLAVLAQQSVFPAFFDIRIPVAATLAVFSIISFSRGASLLWLCWIVLWMELLPHGVPGAEALALGATWLTALALTAAVFTDPSPSTAFITGAVSLAVYGLVQLLFSYAAYVLDARAALPVIAGPFWAGEGIAIAAGSALLAVMVIFGRMVSRRLNLAFIRD